jgi:predicted MPP superfamily phosphohydrolase
MSCKDVAIKKLNTMLAAPIYFKIIAACFAGIFFDILIKKIPKPTEWKAIPMIAQILDVFSEPFIAFAANKLLIKFFDQSNPVDFLSNKEPPG